MKKWDNKGKMMRINKVKNKRGGKEGEVKQKRWWVRNEVEKKGRVKQGRMKWDKKGKMKRINKVKRKREKRKGRQKRGGGEGMR